ncbi:hypothetical protein NW768_007632 [Fusarium equiseti]|uniref:Minor tail protein n=1 Tax=Fusarium equiseti TaxID=61235 RepID=A0ABQ8R8C5_FUSEQ|nr:hypothetical protein NW768_007632 [Fusarium equiseti]
MEVAGIVADVAMGLINQAVDGQATAERQEQVMNALTQIQDALEGLQVQQEQLADIEMLFPAVSLIEAWQKGYPIALQNNDTEQISTFLTAFNKKGAGGAEDNIQVIFDLLRGKGEASSGQSGATPLVQLWHNQSYQKMYNAPFQFTMKNYLDDFDNAIGWAFGMAGFALACQIIAIQQLADKTTTQDEIKSETEKLRSDFTVHTNKVLSLAYEQFPSFVQKFKASYQDKGSNLKIWFRMWRNNTHVKNYSPLVGPGNAWYTTEWSADPYGGQIFEVYPAECDDAEGIYPAVEFRFDETNHPLYGPATIYSRVGGLPLSTYVVSPGPRCGLTTTTDFSYWASTIRPCEFAELQFNVLPVSSGDSKTPAPAFVLQLASKPSQQSWAWDIGSPKPLEYWILRDDGSDQSTWVSPGGSDESGNPILPPGQLSTTAGPNPVDNGQNQSQWQATS